jgi:hypothetical protein
MDAVRSADQVTHLVLFFGVTFAITWTCFLAAVALLDRTAPTDQALVLSHALVFIGTITPGLAALVITVCADGLSGSKALLDRLFLWRTGARWYLFGVGYIIAIKLAVAWRMVYAHAITDHHTPRRWMAAYDRPEKHLTRQEGALFASPLTISSKCSGGRCPILLVGIFGGERMRTNLAYSLQVMAECGLEGYRH